MSWKILVILFCSKIICISKRISGLVFIVSFVFSSKSKGFLFRKWKKVNGKVFLCSDCFNSLWPCSTLILERTNAVDNDFDWERERRMLSEYLLSLEDDPNDTDFVPCEDCARNNSNEWTFYNYYNRHWSYESNTSIIYRWTNNSNVYF